MYRLTEKRLAKVRDVLETYRTRLEEQGEFVAWSLERDLKDGLGIIWLELKDLMCDMFKHPRYRLVAAYYMQYVDELVASEFKPCLAELYGVPAYDTSDRDERKRTFWESLRRESA